jgi:single-strand DNA-binding protein
LLGRLADVALERVLPSGDTLVTFRLVVPRPPEKRQALTGRRAPTIDTVDCVAWGARERKRLLAQSGGCELEVWGALRRRFYRGPGGLGSRYEVSVEKVVAVKGT